MTDYRPAPKSKASDLIDRLAGIASSAGADEMSVLRLRQEAQRLMTVDAAGAHTVLGGIESLRGNIEGIHDHYRIALQHLDAPTTWYNYSVALSQVQERPEAFVAAKTALDKAPGDKFLLDRAIGMALQSGHFTDASRLCSRWSQLTPDHKHPDSQMVESLANAIREKAFSEGAVQQGLGILCVQLHSENIQTKGSAITMDPLDPNSFLYEERIATSSKAAAQLNTKFVEELVSHPDLLDDPGQNFIFSLVGVEDSCQ